MRHSTFALSLFSLFALGACAAGDDETTDESSQNLDTTITTVAPKEDPRPVPWRRPTVRFSPSDVIFNDTLTPAGATPETHGPTSSDPNAKK